MGMIINPYRFGSFPNLHSLNFDGTDAYTVFGTAANWKFLHGADDTANFKFTFGAFIKFDTPNANKFQVIFTTNQLGGGASQGVDFFLDSRSSTSRSRAIILLIRNSSGQAVVNMVTANNTYPDSTAWHYLAVTYNQTPGTANINLYIDGSLVHTGNKTGNTPSTGNPVGALHMATRTALDTFFDGKMFAPFITSTELSLAQVQEAQAKNRGDLRTCTFGANVRHAWRFPLGQANYASWVDYGTGLINGTMTNMIAADINTDLP